jgi:hypothetical protein
MQEAAQRRKEAEAMLSEFQAQREQFLQTVQQIRETGILSPPSPPDHSKIDTDPIGYMQDRARYDQEMQAYQQQQQQIQATQAQKSQQDEAARRAFLEEQRQKLITLVPEFGDAQKAPEFQRKLVSVASEAYGLTQDELASVVDARHFQVLADAMRWREMQAAKTAKRKEPEPVKSVKPVGRRKPSQANERQKLKQRAKQTQSLDAFAELLLEPKNG